MDKAAPDSNSGSFSITCENLSYSLILWNSDSLSVNWRKLPISENCERYIKAK